MVGSEGGGEHQVEYGWEQQWQLYVPKVASVTTHGHTGLSLQWTQKRATMMHSLDSTRTGN